MAPSRPRNALSLGKRVAFAAAACLLGVLLLEGTLRAAGYPRGLVRSFSKLWNHDPASRRETTGLFQPQFAGRVIYPPELAYDVRFNPQGLRGPPLSDRPRLLLLGDSVTFGYYVADHETYPARLQAMFEAEGRNLEVVNAGCGHFTISDERRYLSERLLPGLEPSAVVLQFCANDVLPAELERSPTLYEQVQSDPARALGWWSQTALSEVLLQGQLAFKRWRKGPLRELGVSPQEEVPPGAWRTYEAELTLLRDELRQRGIPLLLISFPDLSLVESGQTSRTDEALSVIASRLGVPFRSALAPYRAASDARALYLYPLDPHPSPAGLEVLARVAHDALDDHGLLPQSPSSSE